ncbi:MAG: hypothetical protein U1A28_01295 [Patescibacteria group bacterium]|nr:hypothetical protein [Patescibacteria group bacterium]
MTFLFSKSRLSVPPRICGARRGMGLVEALVGTAVVTLVLGLSIGAINHFFTVGKKTADRVEATYLAQEGIEALRFVRDSGFANIAAVPVDTTRYLLIAPASISVTATPETLSGFERTIVVRDVYRANSGDDIVASTSPVAKTLDPDTKLVEVSVYASTTDVRVTLGAYLTNLWLE